MELSNARLKLQLENISVGLIARINGLVLVGLGVFQLLPMIVDLFAGAEDWKIFLFSSILTIFVGISLLIFGRTPGRQVVKIRDAFLITTTCWISSALFSAIPLMLAQTQLNFTHAIFEAVSGITSTGSSVINGLDDLPPGINLWRALLQWYGGLGIIVLGIAVFPMLQIGGMQLFHTESSDVSAKIMPKAAEIALSTFFVYILFTFACAVAYNLAGMSFFDAVIHGMTTFATGGFSSHSASLGYFNSATIEWIAIFFMALGSFPFVVYILTLGGRFSAFFKDQQIRVSLFIFAVYTLMLWIYQVFNQHEAPSDAFRNALFNTVNVLTTTGYTAEDHSPYGGFYMAVVFTMMFIGGSTGSTSSGLKVWRLIIINATMIRQIKRIIYPRAVMPLRFEEKVVANSVSDSVFIFFICYITTFFIGALLIGLTGVDALSSMSASIATLGNVGPGLGAVIGPASNFSTMPNEALWVGSVLMLLGRLEMMTLFVLLLPKFWKT